MSQHPPEPDDRDDALLAELGRALGHDPGATPPPDRVASLRAAAVARQGAQVTSLPQRPGRRLLLTGGVAAGVGGVAGYLGRRATEPEAATAPPTEAVRFTGDAEVSQAALINHTWGTELVLDVRGLAPGTTYEVVYDTAAGEVGAGSLLAVPDVVMKCRFNAAPLRTDVRAISVRGPDGLPVLRADLPAAAT